MTQPTARAGCVWRNQASEEKLGFRRTGRQFELGFEDRDAGGEAVDVIAAGDGAKFALGEQAGHRDRADHRLHNGRIMVRLLEHPGAAAVAREEQRSAAFAFRHRLERAEHRPQVLVGRLGIADVELDRLAGADKRPDRDGAVVFIRADHAGDQEVATIEVVLILVHRHADVRPALEDLTLLVGEFGKGLAKTFEGRPAAELEHDVLFAACDDEGTADGSAALGNDAANLDRSAQTAPTPPKFVISSSRTRRCSPGLLAPLAIPPRSGMPGRSSARRSMRNRAGHV